MLVGGMHFRAKVHKEAGLEAERRFRGAWFHGVKSIGGAVGGKTRAAAGLRAMAEVARPRMQLENVYFAQILGR